MFLQIYTFLLQHSRKSLKTLDFCLSNEMFKIMFSIFNMIWYVYNLGLDLFKF